MESTQVMNSRIEAQLRQYYNQRPLNQEIMKCHCGRPMMVYQMYIYPGKLKNDDGSKFEGNEMGCKRCYNEFWKKAERIGFGGQNE